MRPGRELDCTIAEQVFGYKVFVKRKILHELTPLGDRPLRNYTKEISAAWEVARKMDISLISIENGNWFAIVGSKGGFKSPADFIQYLQTGNFAHSGAAVGDDAPFVICMAALRAVEGRKTAVPGQSVVSEPQSDLTQEDPETGSTLLQ